MRILIWLVGWDEYTIENVLSAIRKAIAAEVKAAATAAPSVGRKSPRQGAKQLLMDGTVVKQSALRYFRRK